MLKQGVIQHSSTLFSKSPQYRLSMLYNKLPQDIKQVEDLNTFKSKVLVMLLQLNCYAVSEFMWTTINSNLTCSMSAWPLCELWTDQKNQQTKLN